MQTTAKPVTYGASDRPPRGDYSRAREDYTCDQGWDAYTADEHGRYARLVARQLKHVEGRACDEFIAALSHLGDAQGIPRFENINQLLKPATGWEIVAVPGLIPEREFFTLLANRRFPVTYWLRTEAEFDYIVEPDLFHDLFGHVPLLFDPVFADYIQAFGAGGLKAEGLHALEYLSRIYWYTVEFGIMQTPKGLRAYGAGILSSVGELEHCLTSPQPNRVAFDALRLMRTRYKIDTYQETYFVIESFDELFDATAPDFAPLYQALRDLPELPANAVEPGERTYAPNPLAQPA
ncbi:phenylalanine 4-monooxygenase [Achromobacter sp. GG226]|uniref:phenylalanine 4-monooxygenase n=1 Tax=Verticiella alkaliphila TaxID=2779529 RepID=UPI001C0B3375|nr:phenylalanine 4-monooxygenase [Verticiella sp. GG226]MBU4610377.1 phenylalanine 4-monooxygenase [Verticiella sp. GG226]